MYQVLARKYRPRNFAELVGQEHVSQALSNALTRGRLHHAYLFTGTRGVGKTTIARILSKCLNCETGITATPCDVCPTCVSINQGRFIDLIEIDAASRTKVEDTRELLDNVPYAPTQGRYKVYLIDEVHMLSTHSFNALLKTLEEPPEHVKFLLATTDPQKLPVTVLSRCLQFTLRPLPQQSIHDHLADVLDKEQISFDERALWQLAEAAQGSLRDALSLTDQAIAYGQGAVQGQDVQDMLGLLDKSQVIYLLQAIHQNQPSQVSQILQNLANQAVDLKAVLDQLITLLHQVALVQLLPDVVIQGTQELQQQIRGLAAHIQAADLQLYYQIALQGRQDLKHAVTLQQGFDMCILRMLAFRPLAANEFTTVQPVEHGTSSHQTALPQAINQPQPTVDAPQQMTGLSVDEAIQSKIENPEFKNFETEKPDTQHSEPHNLEQQHQSLANHELSALIAHIHPTAAKAVDATVVNVELQHYMVDHQQNIAEVQQEERFVDDDSLVEPAGLFEQSIHESATNAPTAATSEFIHDDAPVNTAVERQVDDQHSEDFQLADQCATEAQSNNVDAINNPPSLMLAEPIETSIKQQNTAPEQSLVEPPIVNAPIVEVPEQQASTLNQTDILPQQILLHEKAELEGEWTIEKWECWLREADITPAVLNLAQHGIMKGHINAESTFVIQMEHRLMATELMDSMIEAIKAQWPNSQITLDFKQVDISTPLQRKAVRAEKALQQADYLLHKEPLVVGLVQQFSAKLIDINLKE